MLVLAAGIWLLMRPYAGISQDALLYSFQALARLHPESLRGDIFLAGVSQDSFTVFPAIHAAAIRLWDIETAAWVLTIAGHFWWFVAAAAVAYRLAGIAAAGLSIALLAALPGYYGAYEVFRYAEPFVTSRLFSEALVLTGIACVLFGKHLWASLAAVAALLVHPLMGLPGVLLVASVVLGRRGIVLVASSIAAGVITSIVISRLHPIYPLAIFDPAWLDLARSRSPFLLAQDWNSETWAAMARTLTLAILAASAWESPKDRRLLVGSALIGVTGLAITIIGASIAEVVLLVQGQAWRWLWLTQVLAILAAPRAFQTLWVASPTHRAAALLAVSGWLLTGWPAVAASVLAVACTLAGGSGRKMPLQWLFLTSVVIACVSAIAYVFLGAGNLVSMRTGFLDGTWLRDGIPAAVIAIAAWRASQNPTFRSVAIAAAIVIGISAASISATGWNREAGPGASTRAALAQWRAVIPVDAEVYWPEHADVVWFELQRRSYVSHLQTAGVLFSRESTMEMLRRTSFSTPAMPRAIAFGDGAAGVALRLTTANLLNLCRPGGADFVVSAEPLSLQQAASPISAKLGRDSDEREFRLFDCAAIRMLADNPA